MRAVLDAGGLTALADQRGRLEELLRQGLWPAQVPAIVLTESLTGDHRRDHSVNRLLRTCQVVDIHERTARAAARLRTATGRAGSISAVDAVVAAVAAEQAGAIVITSYPGDLRALVEHTSRPVGIVSV